MGRFWFYYFHFFLPCNFFSCWSGRVKFGSRRIFSTWSILLLSLLFFFSQSGELKQRKNLHGKLKNSNQSCVYSMWLHVLELDEALSAISQLLTALQICFLVEILKTCEIWYFVLFFFFASAKSLLSHLSPNGSSNFRSRLHIHFFPRRNRQF